MGNNHAQVVAHIFDKVEILKLHSAKCYSIYILSIA